MRKLPKGSKFTQTNRNSFSGAPKTDRYIHDSAVEIAEPEYITLPAKWLPAKIFQGGTDRRTPIRHRGCPLCDVFRY